MEKEFEFKATSSKKFHFVSSQLDEITLEIMDTRERFSWRLIVNGEFSPPYSNLRGILIFHGFGVTTDYYEPDDIPELIPFKMEFGVAEEDW